MDDSKPNNKSERIRLEPKLRSLRLYNEHHQIRDSDDFEIKTFDVESFIKKNAFRLVISIIIFTLIFAIKSLPFSVAKQVSQGVKWVVSYQMDWEKDILEKRNIIPAISNGIKKFVGTEEVISGIDDGNKYISPVEGLVSVPFEDSMHPVFNTEIKARGIEISGESERDIRAIDEGKVINIEESLYGGKKIIIQHDNLIKGIYEGCNSTSIIVNDEVKQGDILGKTKTVKEEGTSVFYFELWKGDNAVNPLDYIELNQKL